MQIVDLDAARKQLSRLLDAAARGEEILIARGGKPVARLAPLPDRAVQPQRRLGALAGKLTVPADFDAPLPGPVLNTFEGR